jgi:hypothetical protein
MRLKTLLRRGLISSLFAVLPFSVYAEDDFPTLDRVEYVIGCMNQHGGQDYNNLYKCVCAVDYLRSQFTYSEYSQAEIFSLLRGYPGEDGGVFRDPRQAEGLRDRFADAQTAIAKRCFLKAPQQAKN